MAQVVLGIAALAAHVRTARQVAVSLGRRAGLPEATLDDVRLAVGEACGLTMPLARRGAGRLTLRFDDTDGLAVVVGTDAAMAAAEGDLAAAALMASATEDVAAEDPSTEGLGAGAALAVLAGLAPGLQLRTGEDGSRVTMRWPIEAVEH